MLIINEQTTKACVASLICHANIGSFAVTKGSLDKPSGPLITDTGDGASLIIGNTDDSATIDEIAKEHVTFSANIWYTSYLEKELAYETFKADIDAAIENNLDYIAVSYATPKGKGVDFLKSNASKEDILNWITSLTLESN